MKTEGKKVELTIDQVEMICNKYCRMPYQAGNQEQLEDICWCCPINGGMGPAEEGCPELPESEISLKIENKSESLLKTCNQTCLKTCKVASNDCISREAAINAVRKYKKEHGYAYYDCACEIEKPIQQIPSAQPDLPEWAQEVERMYNKALTKPYIKKPLAWALYQVWKEYDS